MITKQRRDELSAAVRATLAGVARLDEQPLDDVEFFDRLAQRVAEIVRAEKLTFAVWEGDRLRSSGTFGFPPGVGEDLSVPVVEGGDGLAERLLFSDFVFNAAVGRTGEFELYRETLELMGVRNGIAVGWRAGDVILGTVAAYDSRRPDGFTDEDVVALQVAADISGFVYRQRIVRRRLEAVLRMTAEVSALPDFASMARAVVDAAARIFPGVECGVVEAVRERPDRIRTIAHTFVPPDRLPPESSIDETGAGRVIKNAEPLETDDLPRFSVHGGALVEAGFRRVRAVPLTPSPGVHAALGAVVFLSRTSRPFPPEDAELMDDLARRLGVLAHRAELQRTQTEAAAGFRLALEAALDLGSALDPPEVIRRLLERAVKAVDADRATLSTIDGDEIEIQGSYDVAGTPFTVGQRYPTGAPQFIRLMETRQPLFETYRLEDMPEQARPQMADLRHTVTVPIVENDAVTGVVAVSRRTDRPFAAHEARLLELVTAAAGGALRNARLFQEAESGRRSLRIALEAAEDVAAATGLDDVIAKFLRSACAAAGAPYAALGHVEGEELVLDHSTHGLGVGLRWPMGAEVREAIALGRPAQVAAPRSRAPGPEHVSAILDAEWALTVPLVLEAELVGVISLGRPGPAFDAEEIDSVRRLAPVAALLLRNARLLEEARDASRSKSDFLNMAAHELRTPLAVIRGYLSMLGDGSLGPTPASWQPILGLLDDKSRDLGVIVDSLLTTARLQGGSLITVFTPVDLAAIVRDAVHRATTVAALTDGKIELSGANRPLRVRGDPEHLSRIADNLLGNALKYSSAPARVRVTVTSADGMAEIRVEDKGRGIRAADRERIFEQFVRVEDAENGYPPGTGLGLYIARQFTERHGGTLTVEWSEPGVGSRFLLRLPLA